MSSDGSRPDWPLAIAQVTPYPWGARREVNEYVEQAAHGLAARGHRVLVLAPSGSRAEVRESRRVIRAAAQDPDSVLAPGEVRVLAPVDALSLEPALRARDLKGAGYYFDDLLLFPERLCLENILSACRHGARAFNYAEAEEFLRDRHGGHHDPRVHR